MQNKDDLIKEMITFGYTQQQIDDIIDALSPDYYDALIKLIADSDNDALVDETQSQLLSATTQEEKDTALDQALNKIYPGKVAEKREEILVSLLTEAFELGKKTKDLYEKYNAGDPKAKKIVDDAMKSEEYKDLIQGLQQAPSE